MKQIEVQKDTIIRIHGEDPAGQLQPYDIFYKVKEITPTSPSRTIFGFEGPAMFVNFLEAVPKEGICSSHSGEFIPRAWFNPKTKTARIDAEGWIFDYTTRAEVVDKTLIPGDLVFKDS